MRATLGLGLVLLFVVALPFALRPAKPALATADDTVVIITPHNEAIRSEFARGFGQWYRARTGRTVRVDWRVIGGTSDITRFLESEYVAAFRLYWTRKLGKAWGADVQAGFAAAAPAADATAAAREAWAAFRASEVSCGIDVFFGGGSLDFVREARAGRIVTARVRRAHPEWFTDAVIPRKFTGEQYWDDEDRWFGTVISSYGILYNADALARIGVPPPTSWHDLADPCYGGALALADPTKSSSMAKAFECIIQQEIYRAQPAYRALGEEQMKVEAVKAGWEHGLRLIQRLGANARYFTDSSQKPPIDVAQGDCAAGICIDFYGRAQTQAVANRGASRLAFVAPRGGTMNSVDPIALLRGAPHREVAELFLEFTLAMEGQKIWNFRPGAPGGPERYALRRLPVRRDFFANAEWKQWRSDPEAAPFDDPAPLVYRAEWTAHLFRELAFAVRVMCLDSHAELKTAWTAIRAATPANRDRALAKLGDLQWLDYAQASGRLKRVLAAKNKVEEVRLATELGERFRAQYREARAIAEGKSDL